MLNDTGICHKVQFRNRVVSVRTLDVVATWSPTVAQDSGALVMCAIALRGITQWANTATLTVLPTSSAFSPSPTLSSPHHRIEDDHTTPASIAVLLVVCVGGFLATIAIVYWIKRRRRRRIEAKNLQQGNPMHAQYHISIGV